MVWAIIWASLIVQLVENPLVPFLGQEDPLKKGKATHSSILGLPLWLNWARICLQRRRHGFNPWVEKIPWRRERLPTIVFWLREFHGLCSPWGCKELDTTERLSLFTLNIMLKSDHPFKIIVLKNFGVHTPVFSFF